MPRYDLLALDLDGTLLDADRRISEANLEAIREAKRAGVKVVLASARPPRSSRAFYELLELDTWQVCYGGALLHHPPTRRHGTHHALDPSLVRRIVDATRAVDAEVVVSLEVLDQWWTDRVDESLLTETARLFPPDRIDTLDRLLTGPVTKLMLSAPPERLDAVRAAVAKFSKEVVIHQSDDFLLQVVRAGTHKAAALAEVAAELGVPAERVMAIGDAPNDIEMLEWAGLGVCVANGWKAAKRAADVVTPVGERDAVAWSIEQLLL